MSKSEPIQKNADDVNLFASKKETDCVVDCNLADVQGAPPCNTAPPKYNDTAIIRAGIDSLYLSFRGSPKRILVDELQSLKEAAQAVRCGGKAQAALQLAGVPFKVHPKGQRRYPFVISNNQFNISIAGESELNAPSVYMQISSELLTLCGYQKSLGMARELVSHILSCADNGKISRIDLCCDFTTDLDWSTIDLRAWVCRSLKRSEYREANIFTGYVFGQGGDVLARLYDKTREIEITEKLFFREIWSDSGWNGQDTVWRLEYQLKQSVLKSLSGTDPEFFVELMNPTWRYLTTSWLSLREVTEKDVNRSRWPVNPDWMILSNAIFNLTGSDDIRRIRFEELPSDYTIFTGALGYLTSFMAKYDIDTLPAALEKFHHFASRHFEYEEKRSISLNSYVRDKLMEKRTKFVKLIQGVELGK